MGAVGFAALTANAASFGLLWAYRGGDANMRSAWICTRNDVLGNLAVMLAEENWFTRYCGWRIDLGTPYTQETKGHPTVGPATPSGLIYG
jgi:Co/Zn/Cd efflux system component